MALIRQPAKDLDDSVQILDSILWPFLVGEYDRVRRMVGEAKVEPGARNPREDKIRSEIHELSERYGSDVLKLDIDDALRLAEEAAREARYVSKFDPIYDCHMSLVAVWERLADLLEQLEADEETLQPTNPWRVSAAMVGSDMGSIFKSNAEALDTLEEAKRSRFEGALKAFYSNREMMKKAIEAVEESQLVIPDDDATRNRRLRMIRGG